MPTHLVNRIDLGMLYPRFLEVLLEVLARCEAQGAHYYLTYGYRSFAEQDALLAQVPKVTNARGGLSMHNYGIAVDAVRDRDMAKAGLQPEWGPNGYDVLQQECAKLGLQAGLTKADGTRWDFGHVQFPIHQMLGRRERDFLLDLEGIYRGAADEVAGLLAVWAHLDKILPVFPY